MSKSNKSVSRLKIFPKEDNFIELGHNKKSGLKDMGLSILPEGGSIHSCFSCGACSSGCPASGIEDMDPRKLLRMASLGMDEEVMSISWIWICTMCKRCVSVCPMKIDIPGFIFSLRSAWPEKDKPKRIVDSCLQSRSSESCSSMGLSSEDWRFVVEDIANDVRESQAGFEDLKVPMDKKGATFFLNQNSNIPSVEPQEMAPLWKILHLADADWTYGSTGWASDNYCMFLGENKAWEYLVKKKVTSIEQIGSKVLIGSECGHELFAIKQGLDKFAVPHSFEVKNIIEYYADWIRKGKLKVNSDWNLDLKVKFTVQDPCHLVQKSYSDYIADELRFVVKEAVGEGNFIDMIPGGFNNYCCGGGGGAMQSGYKEDRLKYGQIKIKQIEETQANYVITPCSNCHMQLIDLKHHYKKEYNTIHLWTILCLSMGVLGESERKYLGEDLAGIGL